MAHPSGPDSERPAGPPEAAEPDPPPWATSSAELAGWPLVWRRRWGRRANELQDEGVPWPEQGRRAFVEVKAEMDRAGVR